MAGRTARLAAPGRARSPGRPRPRGSPGHGRKTAEACSRPHPGARAHRPSSSRSRFRSDRRREARPRAPPPARSNEPADVLRSPEGLSRPAPDPMPGYPQSPAPPGRPSERASTSRRRRCLTPPRRRRLLRRAPPRSDTAAHRALEEGGSVGASIRRTQASAPGPPARGVRADESSWQPRSPERLLARRLIATQFGNDEVVPRSPDQVILEFDELVDVSLGLAARARRRRRAGGRRQRPGRWKPRWRSVCSPSSRPVRTRSAGGSSQRTRIRSPGRSCSTSSSGGRASVSIDALTSTPESVSIVFAEGRFLDLALLLLVVGGSGSLAVASSAE